MKVTFKRTGGFAPIPFGCRLDTDDMPAAQASKLEQLVAASGIETAESAKVEAARDVHTYNLTVETDNMNKSVSFDQISLPANMKALIEFLKENSKSLFDD